MFVVSTNWRRTIVELITYSDGISARGRKVAAFVIPHNGEPVEFLGKTIPGLARVLSEKRTKNGKWSHNTYQIELHNAQFVEWRQYFDGGEWVNAKTWEMTIEEVSKRFPVIKDPEKFLRLFFQSTASRLDEEKNAWMSLKN